MLQLDARNTETGSSKASKLMLVDLAGSEKVKKTHATGQTLKEAKQINKSLMVLGLVINSLVENKKHIPYRDSKLTRLLSDALGGNSKTMLIVTASPSKYNQDESLSTLRFGNRAKSIKNEAKVNQELSVAEYKKLLDKANKREDLLKQQIRNLQTQNDALLKACKDNDIDTAKVMKIATNGTHKAAQNTQALVTMVPKSGSSAQNSAANVQQIEALQAKLDSAIDDRSKLEEQLEKKKEENEDAAQELNECHTHIQEMHGQIAELEKRYEELYSAKAHLDKLFQSISSGNDASQNRFATEKSQWNQDKMEFLEEIRTKDNKIEELQTIQMEHDKTIKELREKMANMNGFGTKKDNEVKQESIPSPNGKTENDDQKQKMTILLDTARKYRAASEKYAEENKKYKEKLKAYKRRDEVNKQLRDNWNKQLNQMEQAVLLANEIYNRERTRHEAEMAEKDVEILKLRKFLLSFTNRHAKSSKSVLSNGSEGVSRNGNKSNGPRATLNVNDSNTPGARKSRIVKPKVIKAGATVIKRNTNAIRKPVTEQKSDD